MQGAKLYASRHSRHKKIRPRRAGGHMKSSGFPSMSLLELGEVLVNRRRAGVSPVAPDPPSG